MKRAMLIFCGVALTLVRGFGAEPELVMKPGMIVTGETKTGTISVSAAPNLKRTYAWDGASRSVVLWPREERWYGSLGAYYPGPGNHWRKHNGITRGVLQEGQQHFKSKEEALDWLRNRAGLYPTVYRDDGLVVSFGKNLPRRQINVEVWQILINGAKPEKLPGGDNSKIKITEVKAKDG